MAFILINLVITIPAVILFRRLAATHRGMNWIVGASLAFAVFLPCSLALLLQGMLTLLFALIALPFAPNNRLFKASLIVAPIVSYGALIAMARPELRERAALRREFPEVSLVERLKYEARPDLPTAVTGASLQLSNSVEKRLQETERRGRGNMRSSLLQSLHSSTSDQFVLARGFGPIRMFETRRYRIMLPEYPPIPYETPSSGNASPFDIRGSVTESIETPRSTSGLIPFASLTQMHVDSFDDFVDPIRMGSIKDAQHVIGFQPHRFYQMPGTEGTRWERRFYDDAPPTVPPMPPRAEWRKDWAVIRLELIGMLSHPQPVAYVSEHLPQLDELSTYPTRELNDFEQSALTQLQTMQDLVIDEQPDRIRMVGSLRADDNCRRCHTVGRGELLGALTYEMRPE